MGKLGGGPAREPPVVSNAGLLQVSAREPIMAGGAGGDSGSVRVYSGLRIESRQSAGCVHVRDRPARRGRSGGGVQYRAASARQGAARSGSSQATVGADRKGRALRGDRDRTTSGSHTRGV